MFRIFLLRSVFSTLGSRIRLLQEQRLSPGSVIIGTTRSSSVNEFLDSSAKNYPGSIPDNLAAQLGSVVRMIYPNLR